MDLKLVLGNATLDLMDPRICMVLYGSSYRIWSGFGLHLQFAFGGFHSGPYEPPGLYGSAWSFLQKRIWFLLICNSIWRIPHWTIRTLGSVWNFIQKRAWFLYGFVIWFGVFHNGPYGIHGLYGSVGNFLFENTILNPTDTRRSST